MASDAAGTQGAGPPGMLHEATERWLRGAQPDALADAIINRPRSAPGPTEPPATTAPATAPAANAPPAAAEPGEVAAGRESDAAKAPPPPRPSNPETAGPLRTVGHGGATATNAPQMKPADSIAAAEVKPRALVQPPAPATVTPATGSAVPAQPAAPTPASDAAQVEPAAAARPYPPGPAGPGAVHGAEPKFRSATPVRAGGTAALRRIFLDNNIFLEVARGNELVARTLRTLAADPRVRLITGRGVYAELTRISKGVSVNEVAAHKAAVDKLHVEVVDAKLGRRIATYETYADHERRAQSLGADPGTFVGHGEPSLEGRPYAKGERRTLDDLPHLAETKAQGAEIWTLDRPLQRDARALGIPVAAESDIDVPTDARPTNYENVLRLVPEVNASDLPNYGGTTERPPGGPGGPEGGGGTTLPRGAEPGVIPPAEPTVPQAKAANVAALRGSGFRSVAKSVAGGAAMLGLQLLTGWLMDRLHQSLYERDMQEQAPTIAREITNRTADAAEIQSRNPDAPVFAQITTVTRLNHHHDWDESGPVDFTMYDRTTFEGVEISGNDPPESTTQSSDWIALHTLEMIEIRHTYSVKLAPLPLDDLIIYVRKQLADVEGESERQSMTPEALEESRLHRDELLRREALLEAVKARREEFARQAEEFGRPLANIQVAPPEDPIRKPRTREPPEHGPPANPPASH